VARVCDTHASEVDAGSTIARHRIRSASAVHAHLLCSFCSASVLLRAVLAAKPHLATRSGCNCKPRAVSRQLIKPLATARWPVRAYTLQAAAVRQLETHGGSRERLRRAVPVYGRKQHGLHVYTCINWLPRLRHAASCMSCLGTSMITGCCEAPFVMSARADIMALLTTWAATGKAFPAGSLEACTGSEAGRP
jgi:hypothetical protein